MTRSYSSGIYYNQQIAKEGNDLLEFYLKPELEEEGKRLSLQGLSQAEITKILAQKKIEIQKKALSIIKKHLSEAVDAQLKSVSAPPSTSFNLF